MKARTDGFSVLELMVVVLIVGTLSGAALPHVQRTLLRARAVEAAADLRTVRMAVLNYHATEGDWPEETDRGIVPPELEDRLPEGFSFTRERYDLDYDDWSDKKPYIVGVTMLTADSDLGYLTLDLLGNDTWSNGNNRFSWVIDWVD